MHPSGWLWPGGVSPGWCSGFWDPAGGDGVRERRPSIPKSLDYTGMTLNAARREKSEWTQLLTASIETYS